MSTTDHRMDAKTGMFMPEATISNLTSFFRLADDIFHDHRCYYRASTMLDRSSFPPFTSSSRFTVAHRRR